MIKRILMLLVAVGLLISGCSRPRSQAPHPRIISYSPGITDIVFDLGLGDHLVGVTNWCLLPPGQDVPKVGSALSPNVEMILGLEPDLIFVQQDPSVMNVITQKRPQVRVFDVRADSVAAILKAIHTVADATGVSERGNDLAARIQARLTAVRERYADAPQPRVLFLMGYESPGTAGSGTFINELITLAGGHNVAAENYTSWPTINLEMIQHLGPDVILCMVNEADAPKARQYFEALHLPGNPRIVTTTDRRVTLIGSHIADTAEAFAAAIHGPTAEIAPTTARTSTPARIPAEAAK